MLNAAFGSDKPNLGMVEVVKNKELQKLIDKGTTQAGTTQQITEKGVEDFRNRWAKSALPDVVRQIGEEQGILNQLYSGQLEQRLSGLRQGEAQAQQKALDQILGRMQAQDQLQRARLGIGGRNTMQDIQAARLQTDAATRIAMQQAAQERADFNRVLQQQMGAMGQRQAMTEKLALMPLREGQLMSQAYSQPLQLASQVQQMDEANKFRSLYRKRDALERMADMEAVGMEQLGQLTEMAGNVGGMVAGMCWIAREVYGDNRWLLFRHWLLTKADDAFFWSYFLLGPYIASIIRGDEFVKSYIRDWMDTKIA